MDTVSPSHFVSAHPTQEHAPTPGLDEFEAAAHRARGQVPMTWRPLGPRTCRQTALGTVPAFPGWRPRPRGWCAHCAGARDLKPGQGNLFGVDNSIRQVMIATGSVTTFAANFASPAGITSDGQWSLFAPESNNHTIRRIVVATAGRIRRESWRTSNVCPLHPRARTGVINQRRQKGQCQRPISGTPISDRRHPRSGLAFAIVLSRRWRGPAALAPPCPFPCSRRRACAALGSRGRAACTLRWPDRSR